MYRFVIENERERERTKQEVNIEIPNGIECNQNRLAAKNDSK